MHYKLLYTSKHSRGKTFAVFVDFSKFYHSKYFSQLQNSAIPIFTIETKQCVVSYDSEKYGPPLPNPSNCLNIGLPPLSTPKIYL